MRHSVKPFAVAASVALAAAVAGCGTTNATAGGQATTTSTAGSAGPSTITVGTLYASSGSFAFSSLSQYAGLKFWVQQVNKAGGIKLANGKTAKIKIVSYDDQSNASTADQLYNRLITQDHVNVFVSDFGSVLTAAAVTIAQENKQLLFDVSGSGASLFTSSNPYNVLTSLPSSAVWPTPLSNFLISKSIKRVAIIYAANDFDQSQEQTVASELGKAGITPVYDKAVPTSTSDYSTIIQAVKQTNPDAVLELGYEANDIAFLNQLHSANVHFNMVFTAFPGQLHADVEKNVGASGLSYVYSYGFPPDISYSNVNEGLDTAQFVKDFTAYNKNVAPNFLDVAGYQAGLVVQAALQKATDLSQTSLRNAVTAVSGKLQTLEGTFKIDPSTGAQLGESLPVSQLVPSSDGSTTNIKIVYPSDEATGNPVYPTPASAS